MKKLFVILIAILSLYGCDCAKKEKRVPIAQIAATSRPTYAIDYCLLNID